MKPLREYTIQFIGLKEGIHSFDYNIEKKFFDFFEFDEFNDAKVKIKVDLIKTATLLEFKIIATGTVNVDCDLTNEPFDQLIDNSFDLIVKFGEAYNAENEEILILPHGEYEINLAQYIYELIVLSVPNKRIHPGVKDGSLKSEILEKLEELSPKGLNNENEEIDPRWNTLKKLLTDK
jgi:uncharacterized metal-binding protein YceD (DUF177 family)